MLNFLPECISFGAEVIVCPPSWPPYLPQIRLAGGVPVMVCFLRTLCCNVALCVSVCAVQVPQIERSWQLDVSAIAKAITPKTKAVIINNPCNPTGKPVICLGC